MEEQKKIDCGLNEYGTFCIFSKVQNCKGEFVTIYEDIFTVKTNDFKNYMFRLLNDFQSPYYSDYKDKFVGEICKINGDDCKVSSSIVPNVIGTLEKFINKNMRRYQQTVQILNFTPQGFYKKSPEEQKDIQQKIDDTILDYVKRYVVPEFDTELTSEQKLNIKNVLSAKTQTANTKL